METAFLPLSFFLFFFVFLLYRVTGTGNPWAGQVIDTEAELAVGLTTFMSAFVNFGFALDTGSDQKSYVRATIRRHRPFLIRAELFFSYLKAGTGNAWAGQGKVKGRSRDTV